MKVSLNWLKELIEVGEDINKITHLLSGIGLEVEEILQIQNDTILDLEISPQRPDLLGMWGIAREMAIFLNKNFTYPDFKTYNNILKDVNIKINEPTLCSRYSCGVLIDINGGETPEWIKERLVAMGTIPQDNIVDVSNYVMYEMGQPVHIFDLDKITGNIIVRMSKKGDWIMTLDGSNIELPEDVLLICDGETPIAIAGIMGGSNSMVTTKTKNVLVESAFFNPVIIRKGGKKLQISTEASYRFERGGDIDITDVALNRTMSILEDYYGAKSKGIINDYPHKFESRKLDISSKSVNRVLGSSLSENEIITCIKKLGFNIENNNVIIPSYRRDISLEIDLIEEIARLIGYNNFTPEMPPAFEIDAKMTFINNIKNAMVMLGFNEVYTMPFVKDSNVVIANYMRDDMRSLRTNITDGLLSVLVHNNSYGAKNIRIFEVGKVFNLNNEYIEHPELSAIISGVRTRNPLWSSGDIDFFDLKGVLEAMFGITNIKGWEISYTYTENYEPGCIIKLGNEIIGFMGKFKQGKIKKLDIDYPIYGLEIDISKLKPTLQNTYKSIPRFPGVERDISIIVDNNVNTASILEFVKKNSPNILEELSIFDHYKGEKIPSDKVSIGLRLYFRGTDRTLKKNEVDSVVSSITDNLNKEYNAILRFN